MTPPAKTLHCRRRGVNIVKARRRGSLCEIVSPRNVQSCTNKVSLTWVPKHDLHEEDSSRHTNMEAEMFMRPQLQQRTTGNKGLLKLRKVTLPRKKHTKWLSNTTVSFENTE